MAMDMSYRPARAPLALADRAIGLLNAIPYSVIALIARAATFSVFFRSGTQKLSDWNATLMLFEKLLGMVLVIQTFIYPQAWPDHIQWLAFMFILLARGPGKVSLDAIISRLHGTI